ncbi:DUF72 domain-containing protein [Microbacterium sp. ARD32]|uniref:DUF72 domain-containing protein n=1 Tax=Microbacterium sp. ARD32 TaxID=2962577 RepID=UPI0028822E83|nr:DUF72 domain-containing protein [Microbacterium sp. ARD32]MDT0157322.1 DUF72 domain-containing protein [Microbacterium sp. ARD32]
MDASPNTEGPGPGGRIRVGTSGWRYASWRGDFYPRGLVQRRELAYLGDRLSTVEINGSFYSLQRPDSYRRWRDSVPDDFTFAVKGSRYITHMRRLRDVRTALANFFASGVLALGPALGPFLWQLPARLEFDQGLLEDFIAQLPTSTAHAQALAGEHDERLDGRAWLEIDEDRPLRHALEPRARSFDDPALPALLRAHGVALAVADTAGRWPRFDADTADFAYLRLHGSTELYTSGYDAGELRAWARQAIDWAQGDAGGTGPRDVYVYFDNDAHGHAPHDAVALAALIAGEGADGREG